jgi:TonB family protein
MSLPRSVQLRDRWCLAAVFCLANMAAGGQSRPVVCVGGMGSFRATAATRVTVWVGARRAEGFAERACQATLTWNGRDLVVEPMARAVDVDAMGVDLGFGVPALALQVRATDHDAEMKYEIYSLAKPPVRLREIAGGDWYATADTDLDGRVEIWTDDAATVDGLDGIPLSDFDHPPTMVLRFENKRLIDVGAEFQSAYDGEIAALRTQLEPGQLSAFKHSDGRLADVSSIPVAEAHNLVETKIRILEIVWGYLYSGREGEAWKVLAGLWPTADYERIRGAIEAARARGMGREVDGVSDGKKPRWTGHERIYGAGANFAMLGGGSRRAGPFSMSSATAENLDSAFDKPPSAILLWGPETDQTPQAAPGAQTLVELVIDEAGKVRSAKPAGPAGAPIDQALLEATTRWKFIPAFKDGRAVTSRMQFSVWSEK